MTTKTSHHKSWRDLPPEPPFGDVPEAPPRPAPYLPADSLPAPEPPGRRWSVVLVPLAVLAVILGIVALVWALTGGDEEAASPADAVAPTVPTPLPADPAPVPPGVPPVGDADQLVPPDFLDRFGRNFFDEFAPDLEIPDELLDQFPQFFFEDFGREFFGEGGPGLGLDPQELDRFLPGFADELRRFFEQGGEFNPGDLGELFDALPPDLLQELPGDMPERLGDLLGPGSVVGVTATYVPDGFSVVSASQQSDGRTAAAQIQLAGPAGSISVAATTGPEAEAVFDAADGDLIDIAGAAGREAVVDQLRMLTYRKDGATVIITAPAGLDRGELLRLAAGIEVDL